jgi:hypothetical protein
LNSISISSKWFDSKIEESLPSLEDIRKAIARKREIT